MMAQMVAVRAVAAVHLRRVAATAAQQMRALHQTHAPCMANRFPRRSSRTASASSSSTASVAVRASDALASDVIASSTIAGQDAQIASVRLGSTSSIKVDPSCLISVPLGVEVRPIYGAPQPIAQAQAAPQQQGGLFARLREATPAAPQAEPPVMLAEVTLQAGQSMPADSVQLGPVTSSKLHTLNLADYGHEVYIARGAFLAGAATVDVHNIPPSNIPGLTLQRVDGEGSLMLKISGQPILKNLGEGEQIFVQANRIVAVESSVQVLGAPGQLLTNIVGPGKVVLQSLPSLELALVSQAENTQQAMQASGVSGGALGSPFGGPMGMGGGLGSMVMQGAAFGVGSAIAHRAFDSAFGGPSASTPPPAPEAPPADMSNQDDSGSMDSGSGEGNGSFFGSMFGGDEDGGDDDGGDSDW